MTDQERAKALETELYNIENAILRCRSLLDGTTFDDSEFLSAMPAALYGNYTDTLWGTIKHLRAEPQNTEAA